MNVWTGMGRLVKDPETNYTPQGKVYTLLTLDVNWNYKTAEAIGNYVHKGQRLLVEGTLNIRSYEGKDGAKHRSAEINVRNFHFIEKAEKKGFGEDMGNVMEADIDVSNVPFW